MFHMPSFPEMVIILAIGLLLFGKRLPEVGKSLGKGIVEFKKGLAGIEDEIRTNSTTHVQPPANAPLQTRLPENPPQATLSGQSPPAPKFDPYTGKPLDQTSGV